MEATQALDTAATNSAVGDGDGGGAHESARWLVGPAVRHRVPPVQRHACHVWWFRDPAVGRGDTRPGAPCEKARSVGLRTRFQPPPVNSRSVFVTAGAQLLVNGFSLLLRRPCARLVTKLLPDQLSVAE